MYLYIELWKAKESWFKLTPEQRKEKINDLLAEAKKHPITGVIPFSFKQVGNTLLLDGVTEQPIVIDPEVARPPKLRYVSAYMIPTRELIAKFEERVDSLGWWWDYFEQENAWGEMNVMATVADMINYSGKDSLVESLEASQADEESIRGPSELKEWGEVMRGQWVSNFTLGTNEPGLAQGGSVPKAESSSRWVLNGAALEGEFRIGRERGMWLTGWDAESKQIVQHTVNSNGSMVQTFISKRGDKWVWNETAIYPDGEKEHGTNIISISDGGNTLEHHHTDRIRDGQALPDIHSKWQRIGK